MLSGSTDFVLRGDVLDLAVAVVIGSASTATVSALSTDVLGNLLAALLDAEEVGTLGVDIPTATDSGSTAVVPGTTVAAVLDVLVVSAVLHLLVVLPMNRLLALREDGDEGGRRGARRGRPAAAGDPRPPPRAAGGAAG